MNYLHHNCSSSVNYYNHMQLKMYKFGSLVKTNIFLYIEISQFKIHITK